MEAKKNKKTLIPYNQAWIYERCKENLQQESFLQARSPQKSKPLSSPSLLPSAAQPLHFINSKDSRGTLKSRLSPPLPPPPPPPPFMLSTSPETFNRFSFYISCLLSFLFALFSRNHPFLLLCSFCVARQPCNCGPYETRPYAGRPHATVPTYSHSPSAVFCSRSIVINALKRSATHVVWLDDCLPSL